MTSEKDRIRKEAKRFRDQLDISPDWAAQAADIFFEAIKPDLSSIVSVYYPIGKEIDPSPIVERLWASGVQVALPVITAGQRALDFVVWDAHTPLAAASFGTYEPEDTSRLVVPDIVIVPLLAFDQRGNRMGYGQGHYDATLSRLRAQKNVLAVGLAYAEQAVLLPLPAEPHDQRLDLVVTPQRIFDFRS